MLFYGPPGTGKTSTILALSRSLFGPQLHQTRILELNASDERGISLVRTKIKDFARQTLSQPPESAEYRAKYPCPPFKIIILDEADSMTQDAQSALRRTMEQYAKVTRFCLVCNYVTRIIEPLASRCSKMRFKALDGSSASTRLSEIAAAEGVEYESGVIERLVEVADGDLRRAITYLQSAGRLVGAGTAAPTNKKKSSTTDEDEDMADAETLVPSIVKISDIDEIAGTIPKPVLSTLISALTPPNYTYTRIAKIVTDMVADGWSATQLLTQMYSELVVKESDVTSQQKNGLVAVFSEVDKRLVDGADEHLAILDMALRVGGIMAK